MLTKFCAHDWPLPTLCDLMWLMRANQVIELIPLIKKTMDYLFLDLFVSRCGSVRDCAWRDLSIVVWVYLRPRCQSGIFVLSKGSPLIIFSVENRTICAHREQTSPNKHVSSQNPPCLPPAVRIGHAKRRSTMQINVITSLILAFGLIIDHPLIAEHTFDSLRTNKPHSWRVMPL